MPLSTLGQLDRGRSQHRPRDAAHLYGGLYPFIQTGDVANSANGLIIHYTQTYSDAGLAQSRLWPKDTLCITIAANIAKTAILAFDACFPDSVVGFMPGPDIVVEYVRQWFVSIQSTLEDLAPQAAQKNINLQILRNLQIPLPPLSLQMEFANMVAEIRIITENQNKSRLRLETLFQSLLAQAFTGDLTATWREKQTEHALEVEEEILGTFHQFVRDYTEKYDLDLTPRPVALVQRPGTRPDLSEEQIALLYELASVQGYFTAETLKAKSDLPLNTIRQGLHLFAEIGLIRVVRLPDRPMQDVVVYILSYRGLREEDQAKTLDLDTLLKEAAS